MLDSDDAHRMLNAEILAAAKQNYAEEMGRWTAIEKKADGAISLSGILLAAIFAFAKDLIQDATLADKFLIGVSIVFLLAAIVVCLVALWRRRVPIAPPAETIRKRVGKVVAGVGRNAADFPEAAVIALNSLARPWEAATEALAVHVNAKSRLVGYAHVFILATLGLVLTIAVRRYFCA